MHISPAQKWRRDLQTPPTSLYLGRHDRETKELLFSSVVAQIHWHGCANMPHDLCCVVRVLYTSTHVHTCSLRCFLHPADTPCRGHARASFRLFSSLRAISNNLPWWYGTEAGRHVMCSSSAWWQTSPLFMPGEENGPQCTLLPLAVCTLVAPGLPLSLGLWTFCVSMWPCCSGRVIYTEKSKKGLKWPSLSASPSHRGFRWVLSTGCLSLLTVLLPVAFVLFIISVILGCKIDTLLSHTSAKDRNTLFFIATASSLLFIALKQLEEGVYSFTDKSFWLIVWTGQNLKVALK